MAIKYENRPKPRSDEIIKETLVALIEAFDGSRITKLCGACGIHHNKAVELLNELVENKKIKKVNGRYETICKRIDNGN
jgi:predicted transcriptional regulator